MNVILTSGAEQDLTDGYWFYERQLNGLGDYFTACLISDIESLAFYAGIHEIFDGYHRALSKRFPFTIYYRVDSSLVIVVAVLDARRDPMWTRTRLTPR